MAAEFEAPLPTTGQKPWTLNPAVVEMRNRQGVVEDIISTGRLSEEGLAAEIGEAAASVAATDSAVSTLVSDADSDTHAAIVTEVDSAVSPVADSVADLETLTTAGRLGEAGLSDTIGQATVDKLTAPQVTALVTSSAGDPIRTSTLPSTGIAFITDSIGTFGGDGGTAWHWIMCSLSNGRLLHRGRFGTAGYTLTQIRDTHLPTALALSPKPGAIAICGGTNDVGGVGYNEATSRAVLLDIIERVKAAGIKPVLWTLPPRDDSTTVNRDVQRWNAWLRYFAATHGYPLIDSHAVFVNESTGLWQTALRQDEIHPGTYGHFVLGSTMATDASFLARFPDLRPYLSASKGADPNMIPANARFFDAGVNGATSPNNWTGVSLGTNASGSEVTDAAIPGNWFRFTKTTSSPSGQAIIRQQISAGTTTFEPGDRISVAVPFRVSSDPLGNVIGTVTLIFRTDTATISALVPVTIRGVGLSGIAYAEAVVPAGCTNVRLEIAVSGTPVTGTETFDVSRPTLLSLTKLGAA